EVRFLQIWVFPNQQNVTPRYDQQTFDPTDRVNKWQTIVSPFPDEGGTWIHQNAWFHLGSFDEGHETGYTLRLKENGVYVFVLSGSLTVAGTTLATRDGLGITGVGEFSLKALVDTEVLLMEVPMSV
ncbi:MAG: pirin family protein, partial [Cyclobacteriaceae bacterium]|nr:pirin family protein [Cyclobacteriaceae bacterium]